VQLDEVLDEWWHDTALELDACVDDSPSSETAQGDEIEQVDDIVK